MNTVDLVSAVMMKTPNAPDWIRTNDLLLRRQLLYPTELQVQNFIVENYMLRSSLLRLLRSRIFLGFVLAEDAIPIRVPFLAINGTIRISLACTMLSVLHQVPPYKEERQGGEPPAVASNHPLNSTAVPARTFKIYDS